jgi:hypothetical protein
MYNTAIEETFLVQIIIKKLNPIKLLKTTPLFNTLLVKNMFGLNKIIANKNEQTLYKKFL